MEEINQDFYIFESIENDNNSINNSENNNNSNNIDEEESSEESSEVLFIKEKIQIYNKEHYILKDIIKILMKSNILSNQVICSKCNNIMKLI